MEENEAVRTRCCEWGLFGWVGGWLHVYTAHSITHPPTHPPTHSLSTGVAYDHVFPIEIEKAGGEGIQNLQVGGWVGGWMDESFSLSLSPSSVSCGWVDVSSPPPSSSSTHPPTHPPQIGYNNGQNPFQAAQTFIVSSSPTHPPPTHPPTHTSTPFEPLSLSLHQPPSSQ